MRVRDWMSPDPVTVEPSPEVAEASRHALARAIRTVASSQRGTNRAVTRPLGASRTIVGRWDALTAALVGDPGRWLPCPARRRGIDRWTIDLAAGAFTRSVACHVGPVWRIGDATWRTVSWEPRPEPGDVVTVERLLPFFRGELGLRDDGDGFVLSLRGGYAPPARRIGAAVDTAVLHRVAQATADQFLSDVARNLELLEEPSP